MNIEVSYKIEKEVFFNIFRSHLNFKFRLHRSMYLSLILYLFGLGMQYGIGMDFAFLNRIVFWIMVVAILLNIFSDFYLPRKAYQSLLMREESQGNLKLTTTGICITQGKLERNFKWEEFDICLEIEEAFLLYQRDVYYILPKSLDSHTLIEISNIIKDKVTKFVKK